MFNFAIRQNGDTVITAFNAQHNLHVTITYSVDPDKHIIKAVEAVERRANPPEGTMYYASTGEDMNALYQLLGLVTPAKFGQVLIGLLGNAVQQTFTPKYQVIPDEGRKVAENVYSNEPLAARAPFKIKPLHIGRLIVLP